MQIKVLRKSSSELNLEIEGEGHSFCNVLQKALLEDKTVEMAGYNVPHPLTPTTTIYVRTKGRRKPETAMQEAAEKVRMRNREFRDAFEKALKEWQQ